MPELDFLRRLGAPLAYVSLSFYCSLPAAAGAADWLALQAPTFRVVSQLDERQTRAWAVEFDRFMHAMHTLYAVEQVALPPLTIVLFREPRDFAPYRLRTDSGQAQIAGFYGNTGDWAVIGLPADGPETETRQTIYHEAVHWFSTARGDVQPLWFSEGLAEVLSTFEIVDGRARWGTAIEDNVAHLSAGELLPMQDFLRASQDDSLHGGARDTYYPQAWALVHYLLFGSGGIEPTKLAAFLRELEDTRLDSAAGAAFGKSYDELTRDLRRYVERGRYGYAEIALRARSSEMSVEPAAEAGVEFALGRLATVGGNLDLARRHARRVIELAPDSPAGYELEAYAAHEAGDEASLAPALDRASELGSREAWIYATRADRVLLEHQRDEGLLDESLQADAARAAADLYQRALTLRPRNRAAFTGFVMALLNVDAPTDADRVMLEAGRALYPTEGLLLVGQAAAAKSRGNVPEAVRLLAEAAAEPFTMPRRYRRPVSRLRNRWFGDWFLAELGRLAQQGRFVESRALVAEHLADETLTGPLRTMLEAVELDLPDLERLHAAAEASRAGETEDAAAILTALATDPKAGERVRREAQRMLEGRAGPSAEAH